MEPEKLPSVLNDSQILALICQGVVLPAESAREGQTPKSMEALLQSQVRSASLDLTLSGDLRRMCVPSQCPIGTVDDPPRFIDTQPMDKAQTRDPFEPVAWATDAWGRQYYDFSPGDFCLGSTRESFRIPPDLLGFVQDKSSQGRIGMTYHLGAGFVDPGFGLDQPKGKGSNLTLELSLVGTLPVRIYQGMPVAQIIFFRLEAPALRDYTQLPGSHYLGAQGQGTVASRYHRNLTKTTT